MRRKVFKIVVFLSLAIFLHACSDDKSSDIEGRWILVAVLVDPGDGSGTFKPAEQQKYLVFGEDNTVASNESHCLFSGDPDEGKTGTYSLATSRVYFDCDSGEASYGFTLENGELILNFPQCIEPCLEKYVKQAQ